MTPDAYVVDVLIPRQQAYQAKHPSVRPWLVPLLEWFIRDGDDALVDLPVETPPLKAPASPRRFRSVASLTEQRDRLQVQRDRLGRAMSDDPATSRVGATLARRNAVRMDRELGKATDLDRRIAHLNHRIALAINRERLTTETEAAGPEETA